MSVAEFQIWWARYPRKVGKLAAEREYQKARKRATAQELLDGIAAYERAKADYADYCHPRTFLSQGRWLDEAPSSTAWHCPHEPKCLGRNACDVQQRIAKGKVMNG